MIASLLSISANAQLGSVKDMAKSAAKDKLDETKSKADKKASDAGEKAIDKATSYLP